MDQSLIRNFSVIAHIDHGKSTLSDRFIQICGGLSEREMSAQVLDSMDIERERGITVKAQAVCLEYTAKDGKTYQLNFIDTPGHVDFAYEVSRSLAACEGALLVVDASQGVEAQSVANCYTAIDLDLEVMPVLNKIDLPAADPDRVRGEIEEIIGIDAIDAPVCSAKTGLGVEDVLEALVARIPPPKGDPDASLKALVVDSWFDPYVGVTTLVRVLDGQLRKGDKFKFASNGRVFQADQVGVFKPKKHPRDVLGTGQSGYLIAGIKDISVAKVGDTILLEKDETTQALPGFKEVQPKVFAGLFPVESDAYEDLRDALGKLCLNDSSLHYEPESSAALGFGFRCGFLGLLHMEIVQERLEREYNLDLITTAPSVVYEVEDVTGEISEVHNPSQLPPVNKIREVREPIIKANILTPNEYVGEIMQLCIEKRGVQKRMDYAGNQVQMSFEMPLAEVVLDFYDRLKSVSRGYASFDYEIIRRDPSDLVKVDILINGDAVDSLAVILHRTKAQYRSRSLVEKMKELIPRQMFEVAIQATIGTHVIARSTVKAMRKNVLAKCYGGDVSRKRKLLEKQKAGKKRMKQIGSVELPQSAFLAVLQVDD